MNCLLPGLSTSPTSIGDGQVLFRGSDFQGNLALELSEEPGRFGNLSPPYPHLHLQGRPREVGCGDGGWGKLGMKHWGSSCVLRGLNLPWL